MEDYKTDIENDDARFFDVLRDALKEKLNVEGVTVDAVLPDKLYLYVYLKDNIIARFSLEDLAIRQSDGTYSDMMALRGRCQRD